VGGGGDRGEDGLGGLLNGKAINCCNKVSKTKKKTKIKQTFIELTNRAKRHKGGQAASQTNGPTN